MPKLFIIAGSHGAGKSTFSTSLLPTNLTSFDYDALYLSIDYLTYITILTNKHGIYRQRT